MGPPGTHATDDAASKGRLGEASELQRLARWAAQQLAEWDAYQKRPERGDYGVECACCMGEMFDAEDRDMVARILELTK